MTGAGEERRSATGAILVRVWLDGTDEGEPRARVRGRIFAIDESDDTAQPLKSAAGADEIVAAVAGWLKDFGERRG